MAKKEVIAFILDFLFIISAVVMWSQAKGFFNNPFFWLAFDEGFWQPVVLQILSFTSILFFIGLMSALRIPLTYTVIGYVFGAVPIFFLFSFSLYSFVMVCVFVLICVFFDISSKRIVQNYIKLSFWHTLHAPLGRLMLYLIICVSIGYYHATMIHVESYTFSMPDQFSKEFIRMLVQGNPDVIKQTQISSVTTLLEDEDYMNEMIDQQVIAQGGNPDDMSEKQRTLAAQEIKKQIQKQTEQAPTQAMDEESFIKIVKKQIEDQMNGLIQEYRPYVPAVSTFLFITALGFFNFFAVAVAIGGIIVCIKVLKKMQIVQIQKEQQYVERVYMI